MKFTTFTFSLILLSFPAFITATPCKPNEIGVGVETLCQECTPDGGCNCQSNALLSSDQCVTIDTAYNQDDICSGGWGRGTVNCNGNDGVLNVHIDGAVYGSYPTDGHAGCYIPSNSICAHFIGGEDYVYWCCPRI